jgi:hypothetical protein
VLARGVAACTTLLLLGACAVHVDPPDADAATRTACRSFVTEVPRRLAGQEPRNVSDGTRAAAWGDPAIVLTCGVGRPDGLTRISACQNWNGVDWFIPEGQFSDHPVDVTMTTVGRTPAIAVQVPRDYWPPTSVMIDLAPVVKQHTRKTGGCV